MAARVWMTGADVANSFRRASLFSCTQSSSPETQMPSNPGTAPPTPICRPFMPVGEIVRWLSGSLLTLLALVHELDTLLDKLPGDVNEALDLISHCDSCMCKIRRRKRNE